MTIVARNRVTLGTLIGIASLMLAIFTQLSHNVEVATETKDDVKYLRIQSDTSIHRIADLSVEFHSSMQWIHDSTISRGERLKNLELSKRDFERRLRQIESRTQASHNPVPFSLSPIPSSLNPIPSSLDGAYRATAHN